MSLTWQCSYCNNRIFTGMFITSKHVFMPQKYSYVLWLAVPRHFWMELDGSSAFLHNILCTASSITWAIQAISERIRHVTICLFCCCRNTRFTHSKNHLYQKLEEMLPHMGSYLDQHSSYHSGWQHKSICAYMVIPKLLIFIQST